MLHSTAAKAADDPDGGGGGSGGARGSGDAATAPMPPPPAGAGVPSPATHDDAGFVSHHTRKARRQTAKSKAKEATGSSQGDAPAATASAASQGGAGKTENAKARGQPMQQRVQAQPVRPKLTAVDIMILQLREHVVMGATNAAIMAVLVQVQHLHRPPGWEKNERAVAAITRTYEYDVPTDCNSIVRTVKHWFTMKNPFSVADFKSQLNVFQIVHVPASTVPQKRNPWGAIDASAASAEDGDDETMASASAGQAQRKRWSPIPRPPTRSELDRIAQVARGQDSNTNLPDFVKETGGVMAAAFLATVVDMQTRGHLVAQLRGVVHVPVNTSQATLTRMIYTNVVGPPTELVDNFKAKMVGARYDKDANAIVFTMNTQSSALAFVGELLPICGRLFSLQKLDAAAEVAPTSGADATIGLDAYDLQVLDIGGTLQPLNILHVFHGILGLEVTYFERAPPAVDGQQDYRLWDLTVKSHGCPPELTNKTCLVWGSVTLWVHHKATTAHPPCTKCGLVSHPTRTCSARGPPAAAITLKVDGPQLDVTAEVAAAAQVATQDYGDWLMDVGGRLQDRSLEAAGRVGQQAPKTYQAVSRATPLYFDYERVTDMTEEAITEKIQEQLRLRVQGSPWLMAAHARTRAQHPSTPTLEELAAAQLQELLEGRFRSSEWRGTQEFLIARAAFRHRVDRVDEALNLGPRLRALQTLGSHKVWQRFERTYAKRKKIAVVTEEEALLALFAKLVRRPFDAHDDVEARLTEKPDEDEEEEDMEDDDAEPSEFHQRMTALWVQIRQEEAQKGADVAKATEETLEELHAELLRELLEEAASEAAADANHEAAVAAQNSAADKKTQQEAAAPTGTSDGEAASAHADAVISTASVAGNTIVAVTESSLRQSLDREIPAALETESVGDGDVEIREDMEEWHPHVDEHDVPSAEEGPATGQPAEQPVAAQTKARKGKRKPASARVGLVQPTGAARILRTETTGDEVTKTAKKAAAKARARARQGQPEPEYDGDEELQEDMEETPGDAPSTEQQALPRPGKAKAKRKPASTRVGLALPTGTARILPKTPTTTAGTKKAAKKAALKAQAGMHQFLRRDGRAEDVEVEFLRVQQALPQPPQLERDWEAARGQMGLRQVDVPGNGSCGPYAAYAMQWGLCHETVEAIGHAKKEAEYYRTGVAGLIHHNYDTLVELEIIEEPRLGRRFLNDSTVTDEGRGLIKDEIKRTGMQPCDQTIVEKYWWTTDELRVLACWLRQPLLVFDIERSGTISAQLHALAKYSENPLDRRETVRTVGLTHAQAAQMLEVYRKEQVVPLVMALDHTSRHFSGLRVDETRYEDHALQSNKRAAMKRRLRKLLKANGMYVPPARPPVPILCTPLDTATVAEKENASSDYSPSEQSSGDGSDAPLVPMRGPGAREMTRIVDDDDDESEPSPSGAISAEERRDGRDNEDERKTDTESVDGEELQTEPAENAGLQTSASTAPDGDSVTASAPLFQASLVTPESQLADGDYMDLLAQLSRQGPVPEADEAALKKAQRDNKLAYKEWKRRATHRSPALRRMLQPLHSPEEACDALSGDVVHLLELLRCLPYVPVLAGRLRRDLFTDVGKDLMVLGRLNLLDRLARQEGCSTEEVEFFSSWTATIRSAETTDDRLRLAQLKDFWAQLDRLQRKRQLKPVRTITELTDAAWGALIVHLLVSPSAVRDQVSAWELGAACDALLSWTSHDRHVHHTAQAAAAFHDGHWRAPTDYLQGIVELSQQSLPPDASATGGGASQY